ncbi:hypothetical protein acdb102_31270 [Acidothermaceae bacterium B102]|nr:hypothetical protein acdb102_31270 [Acidothermaceae bacterium B102]
MSKLTVNYDDMTIGDLEDFEQLTGSTWEEAFAPKLVLDEQGNKVFDDKGRPVKSAHVSATVLKVLVYISERRDHPDFTIDDARNTKIREIEFVEGEPDPL